MQYTIKQDGLYLDGNPIFENLAGEFSIACESELGGAFLRAELAEAQSTVCLRLGSMPGFAKFVSSSRRQPFFMEGFQGTSEKEVPLETQWLLVQKQDNSYILILPFLDEPVRACVKGSEEGALYAVLETGSTKVTFSSACALYIAAGDDPFALMESGARAVKAQSKTMRLRKEKALPKFMKYFGWCTWDSFYHEVSEDKVIDGLKTFAPAGFYPKFLLIDDGWQTTEAVTENLGNNRLTDFCSNEKFHHDLSRVVTASKKDFGVEMVYVWHAIYGYWGGVSVDSEKMKKYEPSLQPFGYSDDLSIAMKNYGGYDGLTFPSIPPENFFDFYNDYHNSLRKEGIDGVKVDVQSLLESATENCGGRVKNARMGHAGLEASTLLNFKGELINCMSTSNDIILSTLNSNMMRSSDDFFPAKPESHGVHIYRNAVNSYYMSEFTHCDWDMFQTGHKAGEFHATARAISGSPVYVSDKPESHNFDIIRKLTTPNGELLLAREIARPTRDRLVENPFTDDILFKIFNYNRFGGVIGAFNVQYSEDGGKTIADCVRPSDVEGYTDGTYAVYSFFGKQLAVLKAGESVSVSLSQLQSELYTVMPVEDGFAPIGLVDKYNCAGAILDVSSCRCSGSRKVRLVCGGTFAAYCEKKPSKVKAGGSDVEFSYENGLLTVPVAGDGEVVVKIAF